MRIILFQNNPDCQQHQTSEQGSIPTVLGRRYRQNQEIQQAEDQCV